MDTKQSPDPQKYKPVPLIDKNEKFKLLDIKWQTPKRCNRCDEPGVSASFPTQYWLIEYQFVFSDEPSHTFDTVSDTIMSSFNTIHQNIFPIASTVYSGIPYLVTENKLFGGHKPGDKDIEAVKIYVSDEGKVIGFRSKIHYLWLPIRTDIEKLLDKGTHLKINFIKNFHTPLLNC